MSILNHPDLLDELAWIEKTSLSEGHRMTLNLWIIIEAAKREGVTYEKAKLEAIEYMKLPKQ